jgi:hypothetical protein
MAQDNAHEALRRLLADGPPAEAEPTEEEWAAHMDRIAARALWEPVPLTDAEKAESLARILDAVDNASPQERARLAAEVDAAVRELYPAADPESGATFPWMRVTDLDQVKPGDWVLMVTSQPGAPSERSYLRALGPLGHSDAVAFTRHGRGIPFGERVVGVMPEHLAPVTAPPREGQYWLYRALERPASGIPGTWCDGLDDNGDNCGKSLFHEGSCRH